MNYEYLLKHGADRSNAAMRQTDMKVRMRLKREAQPLIPLGPREGRA